MSASFDFFPLRNSGSRLRVKIHLSFLHYSGISDACGACQFAAVTTSGDTNRPQPAQRNPRYRINRSDILNLSFPLSPEFNQTVTVQPDGYITLQGAGSICILGMTVPETGEAIKKAYARVLHEPIIDVDLKDFQKAYFIVTGQVTKPV